MHPLESEAWEQVLRRRLPEFGHRNWIVVADSAYPAQSNPGIETIATGADHAHLLGLVLGAIAGCTHIRANVYLDRELRHVAESDAPGVSSFRDQLRNVLGNASVRALDHDEIIAKLDESGKLFRVLILKSTLTIPYTSVFLELDCGYWSAAAESRLRSSLSNG